MCIRNLDVDASNIRIRTKVNQWTGNTNFDLAEHGMTSAKTRVRTIIRDKMVFLLMYTNAYRGTVPIMG